MPRTKPITVSNKMDPLLERTLIHRDEMFGLMRQTTETTLVAIDGSMNFFKKQYKSWRH